MLGYTGMFLDINESVADDFGVAFSTKTALPGVADLTHKILDDMDEPIIHHHSGGVRHTNRHTRREGGIRHEERRLRLIEEVNGRGAKVPRSKNRRGVDNERRVWWKDEVNNPHKARNNRNAAALAWYAEYLDDLDLADDIRMIEDEWPDEFIHIEDEYVPELDDEDEWIEDPELDDDDFWESPLGAAHERRMNMLMKKAELELRLHILEEITADIRNEIDAMEEA